MVHRPYGCTMCGRFTLHHSWAEVQAALSIIPAGSRGLNTEARYNITPMQTVPFVASDRDGAPVVRQGQWWLVPHWAKQKPKWALFNARSEDAHKKPAFRDAFKTKRCLIPADGFYEWTTADDGGKDPHHIHLPGGDPFAFAGLWAHNDALDVTSCTILTAAADPAIAHLHDRMPIILKEDQHAGWIEPETTVDDARAMLGHHRGGELVSHRVGREVNTNKAKGPDLVAPIE